MLACWRTFGFAALYDVVFVSCKVSNRFRPDFNSVYVLDCK